MVKVAYEARWMGPATSRRDGPEYRTFRKGVWQRIGELEHAYFSRFVPYPWEIREMGAEGSGPDSFAGYSHEPVPEPAVIEPTPEELMLPEVVIVAPEPTPEPLVEDQDEPEESASPEVVEDEPEENASSEVVEDQPEEEEFGPKKVGFDEDLVALGGSAIEGEPSGEGFVDVQEDSEEHRGLFQRLFPGPGRDEGITSELDPGEN